MMANSYLNLGFPKLKKLSSFKMHSIPNTLDRLNPKGWPTHPGDGACRGMFSKYTPLLGGGMRRTVESVWASSTPVPKLPENQEPGKSHLFFGALHPHPPG